MVADDAAASRLLEEDPQADAILKEFAKGLFFLTQMPINLQCRI
jgi:hypothetical protein